MLVRFLGTSTSYGVPVIGCRCATCTSPDPRNKRTRASVYIESDEGSHLLVDVGPEMRMQALREGVTKVDAVLFTHAHADHTAGIDDLKAFNARLGGMLPCFGDVETGNQLRQRFAYAFAGTPWIGLIPHIGYTAVDATPFYVGKTCIQPIPMRHGNSRSTGYRIGDFAYLTDTNGIPAASRSLLRGLQALVVDALRWEPHPTHLSVPEALELITDVAPKHAYLTHVSHTLEHEATNARIGPDVEVAYDGLTLQLTTEG
ncbi:MAG: MBL fold metallo-hydrolase [Chloroflexi bacterium]|nr:MBL fold metallo-hydrolase [Chloroflexota bacterium]MBV9543692.1 MBL fold metallo-hydrolase [Chloroflexota bacterium]